MGRRVVLDTNVLVAGLRSQRGAAFRVLSLVGGGAFEQCLSVPLLFEYEEVLKRPETGVPLTLEAIEAVLDYLAASSDRRRIHFLWRPVLSDPSDDLVLEVAVAGGCDTVVTYNVRDFAGSERFGVRAQTPAQFLASLEKNSPK
jgi:putative PIN family toxin of toxin-antitoxin system